MSSSSARRPSSASASGRGSAPAGRRARRWSCSATGASASPGAPRPSSRRAEVLRVQGDLRPAAIVAGVARAAPRPDTSGMGAIRTTAAAAMLGVSPSTLRSWERRFGFPEPSRSAGGHRQYELGEIEALRSAFQETHNVSSAVALARDRGAGPATPARLRDALRRFDESEADRVLEESLAVRSVERSVEEVLLEAVAGLEIGS